MQEAIFQKIDAILKEVNHKGNDLFIAERAKRKNRAVPENLTSNELLKKFATIIAYSQNANSEAVEKVLNGAIWEIEVFQNFDVNKVSEMNPCDLAEKYWEAISGIRQQAKLFHITMIARKLRSSGVIVSSILTSKIPKSIKNVQELEIFWQEFDVLKDKMEELKMPFFRSTTSLLHLLLELGYDCIKPDLVVMKVAEEVSLIENKKEKRDKDLHFVIRKLQEYCIIRGIRPPVLDFYFLIHGGQAGVEKYIQ